MAEDRAPKRWRKTEMRNATITDLSTGEIVPIGDLTVEVPQQTRRAKVRREVKFVMVAISMEAMPKLRMSTGEWQLFWTLAAHIDKERGTASISTGVLAQELDRRGPHVSRSLGDLRRRGIIIQEARGVWRFNPLLLARGSVEDWAKDMDGAPRIDWDGE